GARGMDSLTLKFGLELATTLELMNYALAVVGSSGGGRIRWERERRRHAVAVAIVARAIAVDPQLGRDAFAAGLLHDLGDFVQGPPGGAQPDGEWLHAAVGARLLAHWGVSFTVLEGVAYHHDPLSAVRSSGRTVAGAVHIADELVTLAEGSRREATPSDHCYAKSLGLGSRLDE